MISTRNENIGITVRWYLQGRRYDVVETYSMKLIHTSGTFKTKENAARNLLQQLGEKHWLIQIVGYL